MQIHFDEAKQLLMSACELVHPDPNSPIALTTDASTIVCPIGVNLF